MAMREAEAQDSSGVSSRLRALADLASSEAEPDADTHASLQRVCEAITTATAGAQATEAPDVARLIAIDAANGYGIMAPSGAAVRNQNRWRSLLAQLVMHYPTCRHVERL